ncbi:hypothetical protein A1QI_17945 [Vibrio genomosp. F10 str. 9ZB36]|nr:hypothetical protein A1QI_17945 [Vibrio genomosp. F10 str. 9ZB36]
MPHFKKLSKSSSLITVVNLVHEATDENLRLPFGGIFRSKANSQGTNFIKINCPFQIQVHNKTT